LSTVPTFYMYSTFPRCVFVKKRRERRIHVQWHLPGHQRR